MSDLDDPDDLLLLAVEEAGHAVVAWVEGAELTEVTIEPRAGYLGLCRERFALPQVGLAYKRACIQLAGAVAQMIFTGDEDNEFYNGDESEARRAAAYLAGTGVTWQELLPRVRGLLVRDWPRVTALWNALVQCRTLTGAEAAAVIDVAGKFGHLAPQASGEAPLRLTFRLPERDRVSDIET